MAASKRLRFKILSRDQFTCRYCGRRAPDIELEVDHIVSIYDGGDDRESNLTAACFDCNRGKAAWSASFRPRIQADHIEDHMWLTLPAPKPSPVAITFDLDYSHLMRELDHAFARTFYSHLKGNDASSLAEIMAETEGKEYDPSCEAFYEESWRLTE